MELLDISSASPEPLKCPQHCTAEGKKTYAIKSHLCLKLRQDDFPPVTYIVIAAVAESAVPSPHPGTGKQLESTRVAGGWAAGQLGGWAGP